MISNQTYTIIQKTGKCSLCIIATKQLKELNISKGDKIYCCVEEKDGKKRIIIEGVE